MSARAVLASLDPGASAPAPRRARSAGEGHAALGPGASALALRRTLAAGLVLVLCTCGTRPPPGGLVHRTGLSSQHVATCSDPSACGDGQEPPLGGPHCPSTLACRVYATAQNRCEYLHNLEHGHLVLAYNCPAGCSDVVDQLTAYQQAIPLPRRALVTPDPLLRARVAAMVWGWGWEGDTVDTAMLDQVRAYQDVDAPEPGLGCSP